MSLAGTVVCFDLDDTLVSECDHVEACLLAAGRGLDAAVPGTLDSGEWLVALWRRERARDGFQRLIRLRELDLATWLPRLRQLYREHVPAPKLRAGAEGLISAIAAAGGRLALVSDGWVEVQRAKWSALHLPAPFHPVVFTDERGPERWKPHPWGFERVAAAHPGARCFVYVADNPAKDFIAPSRLGWTTIQVRDPRNLHPAEVLRPDAAPHVVVDSLADVLHVVPCGVG
jgi:putative hydrolase of the HAD superfamily